MEARMARIYKTLAAGILVVTPITLGSMGDVAPTSDTGLQLRPHLTLQVLVSDLNRSIAFYERTLGFTVTERRDDLKFAHLSTNSPPSSASRRSARLAARRRSRRPLPCASSSAAL
jgi:Glyoxalase/Bleomycin resistance protein/Dioxygenase superfamily